MPGCHRDTLMVNGGANSQQSPDSFSPAQLYFDSKSRLYQQEHHPENDSVT